LLKGKSFQNILRSRSLQRHKVILNHPVYIYNIYTQMYRVSVKWGKSRDWEHGRSQEKQKVLYYFAIFAIVNELLIIRNRHISPTNTSVRRDVAVQRSRLLGARGELFLTSGNGYARAARNTGPVLGYDSFSSFYQNKIF